MSAVAPTLSFASAYRQLRPAERAYVDGYVSDVEAEAMRRNERISLALHRAIPANIVAASNGMLDRPLVRAAICERINDLSAATELAPMRVIKEVANIAFSSIAHYGNVCEDGTIDFDLTGCTPEQLAAVKSIKVEMDPRNPFMKRKYEIVLHDKLAALTLMMKYMGLMEQDNPVWRADAVKPANAAALPAGTTVEDAADAYSAYING